MIFKIKKNNHFSNNFFYKLFNFFNFKRKIKFKVIFDESSYYDLNNPNQLDINKLFGFSIGYHHKNSARFGWNSVSKDCVAIYSYCYVNGIRKTNFMTNININSEYTMSIVDRNFYYFFSIIDSNGNIIRDNVSKNNIFGIGYNLWPYFGGDEKAPHNIEINLINN